MNETDKLYFYSKSKDVAPGKGVNEIVHDIKIYDDLNKIKNWRKVLSNFHVYPFIYEGYTYKSIEHVFQAKKIELIDKDKALLFTIDSGHEIGLGDGEMARKHRKLCKLTNEQLKLWCEVKDEVMFKASLAKYSVCEEAKEVLRATKTAELWHIVSRSKPVRFQHLEEIRNMM